MGALAGNRKRGEYNFNLNGFPSPYRADRQVTKKPRFSSMHLTPEISSFSSSQSTLSRLRQYPKPTQGLPREVHAPCRNPKFRSRLNEMGNSNSLLFRRWEEAKSAAFGTFGSFSNLGKDKEVVDVDGKLISEDSSVEEVEILNFRRSEDVEITVLDQGTVESKDDVYLKERYRKFEENRIQAASSVVTDLSNQTPKAGNDAGKMLETLSVNRRVEDFDMSVPPHKRLYESASRRNDILGSLGFQIDFFTKKLSLFSRPAKKLEDVAQEPFVPLTDEEENEVSLALSNSNRRKVLATHADSNLEVTGEMMQCLKPGAWLNDEVINVFLELLKERETREPKKFLKCHFFNTFFYKKLISGKTGYDYKAVKRWTSQRKLGYSLIECDKIFVPIHKEIHWCLAIINQKDKKFQYLDSLKGRDSKVLNVLARYFVDEVKDKSAKDIDVSSWKQEYLSDLPAQQNGFDCGMFMIKYADFYSRGLGLIFKQEHMPYFRRRTVKEILRLKAE